jgi:hypothetical protein
MKTASIIAVLLLFLSAPLFASSIPTIWSDSYDAGDGICRCDSSYDHGISTTAVDTPCGQKSVPEICAAIIEKYGTGPSLGRTYYNTVHCGRPPLNDQPDELVCPGIPNSSQDYSGPRCNEVGAAWPLEGICETSGSVDCSASTWGAGNSFRLSAECINETTELDEYNNPIDLSKGLLLLCFFVFFWMAFCYQLTLRYDEKNVSSDN